MTTETLIIVAGGDYLAFEICREILKTAGHRVVLIWHHQAEREARILADYAAELAKDFPQTFSFLDEDPTASGALYRAGLRSDREVPTDGRFCLVAVSQDDRMNLRLALTARDINEHVRITIRQFNPMLGHKIEEGLKNCSAISPAAHAAATYAAAAVDPSCFYAFPFPTLESLAARVVHRRSVLAEQIRYGPGPFGFCERAAADFGVAGLTVPESEARLGVRVVSVDGQFPYVVRGDAQEVDETLVSLPLQAEAKLVVFGPIVRTKVSYPRQHVEPGRRRGLSFKHAGRRLRLFVRRIEPGLRDVALLGFTLYVLLSIYFTFALHLSPQTALYFVTTTMTTVGYGDITPCKDCAAVAPHGLELLSMFVACIAMISGLSIFAIFTGAIASTLNAATVRRLQGIRRLRRRDHVIVCGAGNVGSLVIDYLREMEEQVVVIEKSPDPLLVEFARDHKIDLMTGDATSDETISYCNPERAKALIGVTNSDTANLEAALGARSRIAGRGVGNLQVVLRIDDLAFGASIQRHFGISSFSTTELTAPTIAGLARFESTRGRFERPGPDGKPRTFQLAERYQGAENAPPPAPPERPGYRVVWIPLFVWREADGKGSAIPIRKFEGEVLQGDRLLFALPVDQFVNKD